MSTTIERYDLIGIGFGPANLSVAIALEEANAAGHDLNCCFIERKPNFAWHPDMLLDGTRMQISFLKDLVTLRNPASTYSFVNYLHEHNRLNAFINMSTFQPTRVEFNDYLTWAANRLSLDVYYGQDVLSIEPAELDEDGTQWVCITSQNHRGRTTQRLAKNIIVAVGGTPKLPSAFPELEQIKNMPSITHSSRYKSWRDEFVNTIENPRIGIVGAGQSAAEIFVDLVGRHPQGNIDIINRERSIHPADDSPFVNEIFDPEFTCEVYNSNEKVRSQLRQRFQGTNYAVVDMPEIESIYETLYIQRITGKQNHQHLAFHNIENAQYNPDQTWTLDMQSASTGEKIQRQYDGIVLATGYHYNRHFEMLSPIEAWLAGSPVERNYRLPTKDNCSLNIYLQGCNEPSHGLSDTLLSVLATRSQEIVNDLLEKKLAPKVKHSHNESALQV